MEMTMARVTRIFCPFLAISNGESPLQPICLMEGIKFGNARVFHQEKFRCESPLIGETYLVSD